MWNNIRCRIVTIYSIVILIACAEASLPDYIKKCPPGNQECILNNINTVLSQHIDGDKGFGLESLNPVDVGTFALEENANSPVRINITFRNAKVYDAKTLKAVKIKGFGKSPSGRHMVLLNTPRMYCLGEYTINGNVLILPVRGEGNFNLTIINSKIKVVIDSSEEMKNDQLYMKVKGADIDVLLDRLHMQFDNLFNGDKAMGDNMNKFVNENWKELYKELKPTFLGALNRPLNRIVAKVFETTPYTDILGD